MVVTKKEPFQDLTPTGLTLGQAETMEREGTARILRKDDAKAYSSAIAALDTLGRIKEEGAKIFTASSRLGVGWKALTTSGNKFFDVGVGQSAKNLEQTSGEAFNYVRIMQRAGVISNADMDIVKGFLSNESLLQSQSGFTHRTNVVERVLKLGMWRLLHGQQVSPDAGVTIPWLQPSGLPSRRPQDSQGRAIPGGF
jgi:hypothetical protein